MKTWERIVGNAVIGGMFTFFASLSLEFPPTAGNLWAAAIGGTLFLLAGLQLLFGGNGGTSGEPKLVPKTDTDANQPVLGWLL